MCGLGVVVVAILVPCFVAALFVPFRCSSLSPLGSCCRVRLLLLACSWRCLVLLGCPWKLVTRK